MKTSILICATCFIVTGCSAQFRFPSLSSALSSLTGLGGNSGGSGNSQSGHSSSSSPYSGLVRDYGRNLVMAMSSIYPTLFKPPQQQQQQNQPAPQSPFEQFSASQSSGSPSFFSGQQSPSFSFGGSTFSISPSLPFGSLGSGAPMQQQQQGSSGSSSPFSASFGSSINSPSSFGPLSSAPFLQQSMPSFAPASSYNSAFEATNGGPSMGSPSFVSMNSAPNAVHSNGPSSMMSQSSQSAPINSFSSMSNFNNQPHESSGQILGQASNQQQHTANMNQQSGLGSPSQVPSYNGPQSNQVSAVGSQYAQQYRPEMMSIAASAPVPSTNSYSNYANMPSGPSQQMPASPSSYQQSLYR